MKNSEQLKIWIQRLMVMGAVLLMIACFATGVTTETEETSQQSILWLISLGVCIGSVLLCISGAERPLYWIMAGAFIGSAICLCEIMGYSDIIFAPELFFCLYLLEFLLSSAYEICRWIQLF